MKLQIVDNHILLGVEIQTKHHFCIGKPEKEWYTNRGEFPIRMRVIYTSQRIEFATGYHIDVAK